MIRIAAFVIVLLQTQSAWAFHEIASFARTGEGGGAGYYYSGSARSKGYDCTFCHVNTAGRISVELTTDLNSGTYEADAVYRIEARLIGEHKGLDSAFNPNTFTAEVVDGQGAPVGTFSAFPRTIVRTVADDTVAIAQGQGNGETEWTFFWTAPAVPVAVTLHLAMLDGDGANDPVVRFIDPLNDDVVIIAMPLCPVGQICEPTPTKAEDSAAVTCSSSGSSGAAWWFAIGLLVLGRLRRRDPTAS